MPLFKTPITVLSWISIAFAALIGAPTVPCNATNGSYDLKNVHSILLDTKLINATDQHGQTLIPPTLRQFANTFATDRKDPRQCAVPIVEFFTGPVPQSIFITIGEQQGLPRRS